MRSTLLVINQGLFFLDINCWGHYFKKINLAFLWQRTWKKAWRIFRAYFSAETEINLFSSDGVQHVCCESRRTQSLNSEAQCWKCEGVGHMTFINGNISAYRHIKLLTNWLLARGYISRIFSITDRDIRLRSKRSPVRSHEETQIPLRLRQERQPV